MIKRPWLILTSNFIVFCFILPTTFSCKTEAPREAQKTLSSAYNYNRRGLLHYQKAKDNRFVMYDRLKLAIEDFDQAVKLDSANPQYYYNRGRARLSAMYETDTLVAKDFHQAIALDSTFSDAFHFLGNYYTGIGDFKLAELNLRKAIEINPAKDLPYHNLAGAFLKSSQYDSAIHYYDLAIFMSSDDDVISRAKGFVA